MKKIIKRTVFNVLGRFASALSARIKKEIDRKTVRNILVFEAGGIGDLLMLFPSINALRNAFPDARLSFLIAQHNTEVLGMNPYEWDIAETFIYDIKGEHRSFSGKISMICSLRKKSFDLIYAPARGDGMREVPLMVFLMGARFRLGFTSGKNGHLNTSGIEFSEHLPIPQQNIALLEGAGIKAEDLTVRIVVNAEDCTEMTERMSEYPKPFFVVHPLAAWNASYKAWPLKNYIGLITELVGRYDGSVFLIGSPSEKEIGVSITDKIKDRRVINLIGSTTISQMSAVIKNASLFIGNDSGPLHIACALRVPSVAVFGPTSSMQLLPYASGCMVVRSGLPCSPCYLHQCDFVPPCAGNERKGECMQISVPVVLSAVDRFLASKTHSLNRKPPRTVK